LFGITIKFPEAEAIVCPVLIPVKENRAEEVAVEPSRKSLVVFTGESAPAN
jgi:hypothetical protein